MKQNRLAGDVMNGMHVVDPLSYYLKMISLEAASQEGELPRRDEKLLRLIKRYAGIAQRKQLVSFPEDVELRLKELERCYPHAKEAIEAIYEALWLGRLSSSEYAQLGSSPVCLIGPPGCGKSTYAKAIARSLWGDPECVHALNFPSLSASFELVGSDSQWESGDAGRIAKVMAKSRYANPIFIADEIDKSAFEGGRYGAPTTVLLHLLERHSSKTFVDVGLDDLTIDCSRSSWILTGNDAERIPATIRSRCKVVRLGYPGNAEERALVVQSIWTNLREETEWGKHFSETLDDAVIELLAKYPPREMRKLLESAAGRCAARQLGTAEGTADAVITCRITPWDMRLVTRQGNAGLH